MTAVARDDVERLDLRGRQRDDTRAAILRAFNQLFDEGNPVTISVPAVAARAGVSVRTLYRYFPNKDALMEAGSQWFDEAPRVAVGGDINVENRGEYLRHLWVTLADSLAAVRAQHASPAGRELRQRRLDASRENVRRAVPHSVPDDARADLVDLVVAVTSSSMFLELVDRMGHEPEHAAAMVDHLVDLLITDSQGAPT